MRAAGVLAVCAALAATVLAQAVIPEHNLPELFSYNHGSHSVAVYRGAALKAAIAAGVVKGFGAGAGRQGKAVVALPRPPPPPPAQTYHLRKPTSSLENGHTVSIHRLAVLSCKKRR